MLQIPDEIKELLHRDSCQKNIRIHFPNGERSDICNNLIVKDSVSFTESLCSQNTLKFGLCESPMFECEVVGVGNIKGATIEVNCEIYCDSSVTDAIWQNDLMAYVYQIPYGSFIVQDAKRQADMNHRKIVAYGFIYNSLLAPVTQQNSLAAFYASHIVNSSSNYNTNLEWLIYGTYPYLFDEDSYNYTKEHITDYYTSSSNLITNFVCNGVTYGIRLITTNYNLIRSNNVTVLRWDELNAKTTEEILEELKGISDDFATNFPDAKTTDNEPFVLNEWMIRNKKKEVQGARFEARRSDYVTSSLSIQRLITARTGKHVMFADYCPQVRLYGKLKLLVVKGLQEIVQYEATIDLIPNDSEIYAIPLSDLTLMSYILKREKDVYDGAAGYSARKAFFDLELMKITNAIAEIKGQMWSFARGRTKNINLKQQFGLLPANNLYPDSNLYPEGVTGGKLLPNDYQSCWYEDDYTKPFGAVQCQYKNTNNEDCLYVLYLTGYGNTTPTDSYQIYELKDNYLIQNSTWTETQIRDFCQQIAANIEGVTYMPVEFVGRGLPYVEAGDTFEILTASNDSITTIVLNRTVSGEQVLTDSYKSVS